MTDGYVRAAIRAERDRRVLPELVRERLTKLRHKARNFAGIALMALVPALSPAFEEPHHLRLYAEILERAPRGSVELVIAAPPQHGKTVVTAHAFVYWALNAPGLSHVYATYNQHRSLSVARQVWRLCEAAGLDPQGPKREFRVRGGTTFKFTSIGGSLTGDPVSGVLIIDDPIKDREQADSARYRDRAWDWLEDVALTRMHPGASVVLMATRWHVDDLSGRVIKRKGWSYLNLRAIAGEDDPNGRAPGEALWPEHRSVAFLARAQRNAYTWASLYQGEPRPRGGKLFGPAHWYDPESLPTSDYTVAHGIDLAYAAHSRADYSVLWTMLRVRVDQQRTRFYVVRVERMQVQAPEFLAVVESALQQRPGPLRWYAAGVEKGAGDFFIDAGVPLEVLPAHGDKFARAQSFAAAWNAGEVLLPSGGAEPAPAWTIDVTDELGEFTGANDSNDDIIDAGTAAYDLLEVTSLGFDALDDEPVNVQVRERGFG